MACSGTQLSANYCNLVIFFVLKIFRTLLLRTVSYAQRKRIQNTCENFVVESYI